MIHPTVSSSNASPARLLFLLAVAFSAAGLAAFRLVPEIAWPGVLLCGAGLACGAGAVALGDRRRPRLVPADAPGFAFSPAAAWKALIPLLLVSGTALPFCWGAYGILVDIGRQSAWGAAAALTLLPAFMILLGGGLWCAFLASRVILYVRATKESVLLVRPAGPVRLDLRNLSVERRLDQSGAIRALILRSGRREFRIASGRNNGSGSGFLAGVADWFAENGVHTTSGQDLTTASPARPLAVAGLYAFLATGGFFGSGMLIRSAIFWHGWLTRGAPDILLLTHWSLILTIVATYVIVLGPPAGWTWKLLSGAWLRRRPEDAFPVSVTSTLSPLPLSGPAQENGTLSITADALLLRLGRTEHRIERSDVLELRPFGMLRYLLTSPTDVRLLRSPVLLGWRDADGRPVSVLLSSRAGRSFGHDRRLDRELNRVLGRWYESHEVQFRIPGRRAPAVGASLAAALLLVTAVVPPAHNRLMDRIANGSLLPSVFIRPDTSIFPIQTGIQAFIGTDAAARNTDELVARAWSVRLKTGHVRPLGPAGYPTISSFPDAGLHYLELSNSSLDLARLTPWVFEQMKKAGTGPARLVSAETGRAILLPELGAADEGSRTYALFGEKRIFIARQLAARSRRTEGSPPRISEQVEAVSASSPGLTGPADPELRFPADIASGTFELSWMEVADRRITELGKVEVPIDPRPGLEGPLFFPDGEKVLWHRHIVDLKTGRVQPVVFPSGEPYPLPPAEWAFFAAGKRLRLAQNQTLDGNRVLRTQARIWELDPETARLEPLARLTPGQYLLGADQDRWLIGETDVATSATTIYLHNHVTSRTVTVTDAPATHALRKLAAGHDWMFTIIPGQTEWVQTRLP